MITDTWKNSPKVYRRPAPDLCLEFCNAHGIEPKLHCLNYDQWSPVWLPQDTPTVKKYLEKRIARIAERYADKISSMEVINETLLREETHDYRRSTDFFREKDLVEWSFETARKYLPDNKLIINEAVFNVTVPTFLPVNVDSRGLVTVSEEMFISSPDDENPQDNESVSK